MNGIGFLVTDDGVWGCSDDVFFDVEKDLIPGQDKKIFAETTTLKYLTIFEGNGEIKRGLKVWCLFKSGDQKMGFTGTIRGRAGDLTIVDIHSKCEVINTIIHKIKGGN